MEPNTLTLRGGPKPSPGGYISQNNLAPAFTIETLDQLEKDLNILPPSKAILPPPPPPPLPPPGPPLSPLNTGSGGEQPQLSPGPGASNPPPPPSLLGAQSHPSFLQCLLLPLICSWPNEI